MRAATADLDLDALRHNLAQVRTLAPRRRVIAVVKANGYGHGAARLLPALTGADALGVACIEEALALREAGATLPILLMEGVFEAAELPLCEQHGFWIVVHEPGQVAMLEQHRPQRPLSVWLKADTGMHRLGFAPEQIRAIWQRLRDCPAVDPAIRLMSHLGSADDPSDPTTLDQLTTWEQAFAGLPGERSFANSAGVLAWPDTHQDWVRPGILLYGVNPLLGQTGHGAGLRPVMTLSTQLIAVKHYPRGARVGYSGAWVCPEDMAVGIAAIGYGDGYPRHAPSGTPVMVNGQPAALAGRVSMDMLAIDLRGQPQARVGDPVLLWGEGLPVETIAAHAGTIAYELLCGVTARVHVRLRGVAAPPDREGDDTYDG